jgi:putative thioredoxin
MFGTPPQAAPAGDMIKDTTTAGFAKDVLEASRHVGVLVHFTSERSAACKQLAPVLEKVVRGAGGKVRLVRMDIDKHPTIAGQLRIQQLPTVYAFVDGRPVDGFAGLQNEVQVRALVDRLAGDAAADDIADAVAAGQQALEANDLQAAAEVFAAVLQQEPQNAAALAGLATCYLKSGDLPRAEQTLSLVPPAQQSSSAVAQVRANLDLAKQAATVGDTSSLEQRLLSDPKDHEARIELAKVLAARGNKEQALDHLLEAIRRDRKWNEEAARKQLVQFFDAWGPKDALTLDGRRRLSSILFS